MAKRTNNNRDKLFELQQAFDKLLAECIKTLHIETDNDGVITVTAPNWKVYCIELDGIGCVAYELDSHCRIELAECKAVSGAIECIAQDVLLDY